MILTIVKVDDAEWEGQDAHCHLCRVGGIEAEAVLQLQFGEDYPYIVNLCYKDAEWMSVIIANRLSEVVSSFVEH